MMRISLLVPLLGMFTMPIPVRAQDSIPAQGQRVFTAVCAVCHTLQPPPLNAPPMTHVMRHYVAALPDAQARAARIAEWLARPDSTRSLLPAHARERWGLMPPIVLPAADAQAVAQYVSSLSEPRPAGRQMRHRGGRTTMRD